jgi:hypothetical protein
LKQKGYPEKQGRKEKKKEEETKVNIEVKPEA